MKKVRLKLSGLVLLVAMILGTATLNAQVRDMPSIDLNGEAKCEVLPDELVLSITVRESDYKGKQTIEEKQEQLIQVLKDNDINYSKHLSIYQMGSTMSVKAFSKKIKTRSQVVYFLTLEDGETMQNVIEDLQQFQISNINLISTKYTKSEELKTKLAVEALKKARKEAEVLAKSIDQEIGKAISINTWMTNNAPRLQRPGIMYAPKMNDTQSEESAVETPEVPMLTKITYTVTVSAKFELK